MGLPEAITVVEVGPRDGLQNEPVAVPSDVKIELIQRLVGAGCTIVEATSFVSPKRIPQLADADEVLAGLDGGARFPVLVANEAGLDRALAAGAREISVFASATESFSERNLGRSRAAVMEMLAPVIARADADGLRVRGYVSMVLGDPWEGLVEPPGVVACARELLELGCAEISLGDTIGVGTPAGVDRLLDAFDGAGVGVDRLAVHFHDTYGQGLVNVLTAFRAGVTVVDASVGGLGGCPFAGSATGNLATEDLVYLCDGMGISTGIDLAQLAETAAWICQRLDKAIPGRVAAAMAT